MSEHNQNKEIIVTILMPCLNEEETIAGCINKAKTALNELGICGEILVADNGSTDRSVEIARGLGARVVIESRKGYGSAYRRGFQEAKGKYIVMADADDTYDLSKAKDFIMPLM